MRTQFDKSILITYVSTLVSLCVSNYGKCKHLAIGVYRKCCSVGGGGGGGGWWWWWLVVVVVVVVGGGGGGGGWWWWWWWWWLVVVVVVMMNMVNFRASHSTFVHAC